MPDTFPPSQNPSGIIISKRKVENSVEITEKSPVKKMKSVKGKPEDGFEAHEGEQKELDPRFYHNKVAEQLDTYEEELDYLRTQKECLQGEIRDLNNKCSRLQKGLDSFETVHNKQMRETRALKTDMQKMTEELEEEKRKVESLTKQLKEEKELSSLTEGERQDMKAALDKFMDTYSWKYSWVLYELRTRQQRLGEEKYTDKQIAKLSKKAYEE